MLDGCHLNCNCHGQCAVPWPECLARCHIDCARNLAICLDLWERQPHTLTSPTETIVFNTVVGYSMPADYELLTFTALGCCTENGAWPTAAGVACARCWVIHTYVTHTAVRTLTSIHICSHMADSIHCDTASALLLCRSTQARGPKQLAQISSPDPSVTNFTLHKAAARK